VENETPPPTCKPSATFSARAILRNINEHAAKCARNRREPRAFAIAVDAAVGIVGVANVVAVTTIVSVAIEKRGTSNPKAEYV